MDKISWADFTFNDIEQMQQPEQVAWAVVKLPLIDSVKNLTNNNGVIIATGINGKRAISNDFGQTWKVFREKRKFRKYKRRTILIIRKNNDA